MRICCCSFHFDFQPGQEVYFCARCSGVTDQPQPLAAWQITPPKTDPNLATEPKPFDGTYPTGNKIAGRFEKGTGV